MTSTPESVSSMPGSADERLLGAHDLALAALREITPAATIGEAAGYTLEDGGIVSLRFANTMEGYPGWFWTVSVAVVEGADPTVLEAELLPGEGALLAPEWIPWAVRLAEYQAAAAAAAEADDDDDDDEDADDVDDLDDLDAADFDDDGSPILHAGDVDGVDIDELDDSAEDAEAAEDADADEDEDVTDENDEAADVDDGEEAAADAPDAEGAAED